MRLTIPETAAWPFGDRSEISSDELNAWLAGQGQTGSPLGVVPPAPTEAIDDWQTSEKKFLLRVVAFAEKHGWLTYHTWNSANSAPGFPDLICLGRGRIVVAELKIGNAKPTADQRRWLDAFRELDADVMVRVWRPEDWSDIEAALAA